MAGSCCRWRTTTPCAGRRIRPIAHRTRLPVDATITQLAYDLIVADGVATGRAQMVVDVLKEGWVPVGWLPKGLHIREASLAGAPLAIVEGPAGTGTRSLLLSRKGRVGVTLEVVVPVATRAGVESLTLPPSPGGLVSAALTVPRSGVDVTVSGGLIVDRTPTGPALRVVSHASLGQALSLSWQRTRDTARIALPLRLRSTVQQVVGLGEEIAQVTARVTADVVQGTAAVLTVALPAGLAVNQVQGALVADWEVQATTLRIALVEPDEPDHQRHRHRRVPPACGWTGRRAAAAGAGCGAGNGRSGRRSAGGRRSDGVRSPGARSCRSVGLGRPPRGPHVTGARRLPLSRPTGGIARARLDNLSLHAAGGPARDHRRSALPRAADRGRQGARRGATRRWGDNDRRPWAHAAAGATLWSGRRPTVRPVRRGGGGDTLLLPFASGAPRRERRRRSPWTWSTSIAAAPGVRRR